MKEPYLTIKVEKIEHILQSVTQFLKEQQISLGKHCFICGKDHSDKKVTVTRIEYYTHETCFENLLAEVNREKEEQKKTKKRRK